MIEELLLPILARLFTLLGVRFPYVRVAGLVISLVCLFALQQFLRKTYTGKAIRATVEDWEAASLVGIDVHKVYLLSFLVRDRTGRSSGDSGAREFFS